MASLLKWWRSRLVQGVAWLLVMIWSIHVYRTATDEQYHLWVSGDVGWQWMLGHALVKGELAECYTVSSGERWLREGYSGQELETMITRLLRKGKEKQPVKDGIDGPLYPPTAAFFFSLYGMFTPRQAHSLGIILGLLCTVATAFLIQMITRNRLTAGFAALLICLFPHHFAGLLLGQNHPLTLLLITLGWWVLSRGKPYLAGLVWGLLIYKPVFLLALMLVPLSLLNGRMFLGMATSSLCLFLATLPLTQGLEPWKRWIVVGQRASIIYELDQRWIWLSRDIAGLPRRAMWDSQSFANEWKHWWGGEMAPDFARTYLEQDEQGRTRSPRLVACLGWGLLAGIALITVLVTWQRKEEAPEAILSAFLLMGSLFCVYHFMFYDLTAFVLPVCLLLVDLRCWRWSRRGMFLLILLGLLFTAWHAYQGNEFGLMIIPWETFVLLSLWAALAISIVRKKRYSRNIIAPG